MSDGATIDFELERDAIAPFAPSNCYAPLRFAYADPPYHGCGKRLYGELHAEAAVWDDKQEHINLVNRLVSEYPDGWAMSCNPKDLRWLLPVCPEDARVGAWVKSWHQIRPTTTQWAWEAVIWCGGRKDNKREPMVRDWLQANATRQQGTPGAKPGAFCRWILDLLNAQKCDTIDDLFPGSGAISRAVEAWKTERTLWEHNERS